VTEAFAGTLRELGIELAPAALERWRGASKRQVLRELLPPGPDRDARAAMGYASFRGRLEEIYRQRGVQPVAGAAEVLAWLRVRGVRVALNTGFDREVTALILDVLGWQALADAVVCADDVVHGRPAPDMIHHAMRNTGVADPRRVANVGDTVLDLEAGARAGVGWNVGVCSGAHPRSRLLAAPHTHLISSIAELPGALGEALGEAFED
jgi:phosphonatase-like hydrolase